MDTGVITLIDDVTREKDAWLEIRKTRIGSSDIAAIAGLNQHRTPLTVWGEMRGELKPFEGNTATRIGSAMEPIIAEEFSLQTGMRTWRCGQAYERKEYPGAMATPDYFVEMKDQDADFTGILEIKNVTPYLAKLWEDGNIPDYAYIQILWQMGITGIHRGIVAAMVGYDLVWKEVKWSQEAFDGLIEIQKTFMHLVEVGELPAIMSTDKTLITEIFKPRDGDAVSLDDNPEAKKWADEWTKNEHMKKIHDNESKRHAEKMDEARANLVAIMGGATLGYLDGNEIKRNPVSRKGYEVKPSSYELFTIKPQKGVN